MHGPPQKEVAGRIERIPGEIVQNFQKQKE